VTLTGMIPGLPTGRHQLTFDLVSEHVDWFSSQGSPTAQVTLDVQ
jgi:hypothetical protein